MKIDLFRMNECRRSTVWLAIFIFVILKQQPAAGQVQSIDIDFDLMRDCTCLSIEIVSQLGTTILTFHFVFHSFFELIRNQLLKYNINVKWNGISVFLYDIHTLR